MPVHVAMVTTEEYSEDAFFVGAVVEATTDVIEQPGSENEWLVELPKPLVTSPGGEVQCVGRFLATSPYKGQQY